MSDENNSFSLKKLLCLMKCPCTLCCASCYLKSAMQNPPDAEELSESEAKFYIDNLQGLWDVIVIEHPNMGCCWNEEDIMGFSRVYIDGEKMTFSGGPNGSTKIQTLSLHQTPEGTIYFDNKGSILTNFDHQNGIIEVTNVPGFKIMWKRGPSLSDSLKSKPCWQPLQLPERVLKIKQSTFCKV